MLTRIILLLLTLGGCGSEPSLSSSVLVKKTLQNSLKLKRCLKAEASRHQSYPLYSKYRGEELIGVRYDRGESREKHRVYACQGLLCNAQGHPLDPQLGVSEYAHRDGRAIFVIDQEGQLWMSFDQKYGRVHHSTLLAGEPVLAAGEMLINTGELISMSNESGHYRTPPSSLEVADRILTIMGVEMAFVEHYIITTQLKHAQRRPRVNPPPLPHDLQSKCGLDQTN